jgi:hypothetical protein
MERDVALKELIESGCSKVCFLPFKPERTELAMASFLTMDTIHDFEEQKVGTPYDTLKVTPPKKKRNSDQSRKREKGLKMSVAKKLENCFTEPVGPPNATDLAQVERIPEVDKIDLDATVVIDSPCGDRSPREEKAMSRKSRSGWDLASQAIASENAIELFNRLAMLEEIQEKSNVERAESLPRSVEVKRLTRENSESSPSPQPSTEIDAVAVVAIEIEKEADAENSAMPRVEIATAPAPHTVREPSESIDESSKRNDSKIEFVITPVADESVRAVVTTDAVMTESSCDRSPRAERSRKSSISSNRNNKKKQFARDSGSLADIEAKFQNLKKFWHQELDVERGTQPTSKPATKTSSKGSQTAGISITPRSSEGKSPAVVVEPFESVREAIHQEKGEDAAISLSSEPECRTEATASEALSIVELDVPNEFEESRGRERVLEESPPILPEGDVLEAEVAIPECHLSAAVPTTEPCSTNATEVNGDSMREESELRPVDDGGAQAGQPAVVDSIAAPIYDFPLPDLEGLVTSASARGTIKRRKRSRSSSPTSKKKALEVKYG